MTHITTTDTIRTATSTTATTTTQLLHLLLLLCPQKPFCCVGSFEVVFWMRSRELSLLGHRRHGARAGLHVAWTLTRPRCGTWTKTVQKKPSRDFCVLLCGLWATMVNRGLSSCRPVSKRQLWNEGVNYSWGNMYIFKLQDWRQASIIQHACAFYGIYHY